jgi:hypothetical protein
MAAKAALELTAIRHENTKQILPGDFVLSRFRG